MIKKTFKSSKSISLHKVIFEYKGQKRLNNNNYNNNKTKPKIFSNVRGQYMFTRAKPRGITLNKLR